MGLEIIGGVISRSLALISDAGHMLTHFVALGTSLFAIIIGILFAIVQDLLMGTSGSNLSLANISENYSQGQVVLIIGVGLFVIIGLLFALNWLWHHGYYLILRLITDLEE